ncbi:hypothetical protein FB45DRAFT_736188 [Roridomyces roridus]|uniref:NmrA-like domain-containing protein n=1 Tax=Roridomyces roridus TaxID=1738132 RepID=A0AAD7CA51_9AGAR|nr:hypothetical protein FB45DRAFT_736188 [Roridomyces roridus]
MPQAAARIVSVLGATGTQGRSVLRTLLKDGTFLPRAIVRNPDGEAAQKIRADGGEVVRGDLGDKQSLVDAMKGSEAVFAVTVPPFTQRANPNVGGPDEVTQGKNLVDAAKEAGVKFFVFSSLPSIDKISSGKYKNVSHYEDKAIVEEYLKESGLANASLHLGCFLENYWKTGLLRKTQNGSGFAIFVPNYSTTALQAFTWVDREVPAVTLALLKNYTDPSNEVSGKAYPVVNANITFVELARMTSRALGKEVTFIPSPPIGFSEMDEMFAAQTEYNGLYTATPVPNPDLVTLGVEFGTVEEWLEGEVKQRFGHGA